MSPTIVELEKLLALLVTEHRALSAAADVYQKALRTFDLQQINAGADAVEACRAKIVMFENRRRHQTLLVARTHKLANDVTISQIAQAVPAHRVNLVKYRDELRKLTAEITAKNSVSAKVATAMMGHLNSVVRMVSGAVRQAAVYTRYGQHTVAARVGVMEAVA
ncbi:MAG: flagellar export chaperone FlgN [Tepidisphaeraceae bacterium]